MTNKQRAKIYRKAAEEISEQGYNFCCQAISYVAYGEWRKDITKEDFPELFLFKPSRNNITYGGWWEYGDFNSRITCLLLCEQIALNPQR